MDRYIGPPTPGSSTPYYCPPFLFYLFTFLHKLPPTAHPTHPTTPHAPPVSHATVTPPFGKAYYGYGITLELTMDPDKVDDTEKVNWTT